MSGEAEDGAQPGLGKLKDFLGKKDFKMPKLDDLLKALDKMDLPEEEKEKLRQSLKSNKHVPQPNYLIFFITLAIVLLIFVFIGRKLYRMMTEKERKQAEKKKLKDERKSKPSKQKDGKDSDKSKKKKN
ncbi:uncharacterized protein LOC132256808 isoform X2 [Phlebotomus argentipes]|uniref:uncharacterized protein LOC132256808 isoform X2 n=1 Tax=Phlebotomus argentipes TaxID=94469 RepID=UPI0028930C25|nr:uncharacterized protein LOC132256808 isoform X2 [Phlebotomus argentipes]